MPPRAGPQAAPPLRRHRGALLSPGFWRETEGRRPPPVSSLTLRIGRSGDREIGRTNINRNTGANETTTPTANYLPWLAQTPALWGLRFRAARVLGRRQKCRNTGSLARTSQTLKPECLRQPATASRELIALAGADPGSVRSAISRSEGLGTMAEVQKHGFAAANLADIKTRMSAPARTSQTLKPECLRQPARSPGTPTALGRMAHFFDAGVLQLPQCQTRATGFRLHKVRVHEMSNLRVSEMSLKTGRAMCWRGRQKIPVGESSLWLQNVAASGLASELHSIVGFLQPHV